MSEDYEIWLEEAKWDLENAEILYDNERFSTSAFQSQQAAEKAVKALLFRYNLNGWGHSVSNLFKKYQERTERTIKDVKNIAFRLDKHYIPTRYPDSLPGIAPHEAYTQEEAKSAIEQASMIIKFVEKEIDFLKQLEIKKKSEEEKINENSEETDEGSDI